MPIKLSEKTDNGLGVLATCSCADFDYHERWVPSMEQLRSRWQSSLELEAIRVYDKFSVPSVSEYEVGRHLVMVSRGKGDPGPHWYCKHACAAIKAYLFEEHRWLVSSIAVPDVGVVEDWTVSLDGWANVTIVGER